MYDMKSLHASLKFHVTIAAFLLLNSKRKIYVKHYTQVMSYLNLQSEIQHIKVRMVTQLLGHPVSRDHQEEIITYVTVKLTAMIMDVTATGEIENSDVTAGTAQTSDHKLSHKFYEL